jgi:hypothetical protein
MTGGAATLNEFDCLGQSAKEILDQLAWWTGALKSAQGGLKGRWCRTIKQMIGADDGLQLAVSIKAIVVCIEKLRRGAPSR